MVALGIRESVDNAQSLMQAYLEVCNALKSRGEPMRARRFRSFVRALTTEVERHRDDEPRLLEVTTGLLRDLVSHDDWLPPAFAEPHPDHYRQYLLHCDPLERFSVVSFVWGPGQITPIHNHTVWGAVGVLRGSESCEGFRLEDGRPVRTGRHLLEAGQIDCVSPTIGDIHRVANCRPDSHSVSIHVYGGNIGALQRRMFLPDGGSCPFVSGYSNDVLPNLWDRSGE